MNVEIPSKVTELERKLLYRLASNQYEYDYLNFLGTRYCNECESLSFAMNISWYTDYFNIDETSSNNKLFNYFNKQNNDEYKLELCLQCFNSSIHKYIIAQDKLSLPCSLRWTSLCCSKCLDPLVYFKFLHKHIYCDYCERKFMYDAGIPFHIKEGYKQENNIEYPDHLSCINVKCDFDICVECALIKQKAFNGFKVKKCLLSNEKHKRIIRRTIETT